MNAKNETIPEETGKGNFIEPPPMRWTLRLIFIAVFIVGIIGNSVVCAAVIRRKRMRSSNNIFTFNLALCDLLNVAIYLPTQMAAFENDQNWAVGNFMCHVVYILVPLCLCASIGTLLAITCDRYRAIAYPLKPRLSGKRVKIILVIIWLSSLVISFPLIIVAGEVKPEPGKVFCDETWPKEIYREIYWNFIFVIQYFLPLTLIAVLAVLIAIKIRQNNAIQLLPKNSQAIAAALRQRTKQTTKITNMLIALVILYAVCMLPQHLVFIWLTYGNLESSKYRVYVLRFSNVFPMANSALNPIVYGTLNKEFKKVFKSFFNCEWHKSDTDTPRTIEGSQLSNPVKRIGKFRLALYKRQKHSSSTSDTDRPQRDSTPSLDLLSTRKFSSRKENKKCKTSRRKDNFLKLNGNVSLSATLESTRDKAIMEDERLRGAKNEYFKLGTRSLSHCRPRDEEQRLLNCNEQLGHKEDKLGQLALPNAKKIAHRTYAQRDTNIYDKKPGMKTLYSKEELRTQQMTSYSQQQPFVGCWEEENDMDKNLHAFITALKETDI